ncbi:MAG: HEPN domain-containing protein [Candidatus Lokiarchaeota archaeon]
MKRYKDWIKQADEDLNAAKDSEKNDHFEWACFQAQQSAEKSLKSFLLFLKSEYDALKEKCQELDMHYIQPRYPNGFASGYPAEYYNKKLALKCIEYAKAINQFIKKKIEKLSSFQ